MKKRLPAAPQSMERIEELAARRENYIRRTGQNLSIKHACYKLGLYSTTVKKLAPELFEKWNDLYFRWE